jgi:thiol:disulfide interchange protein
MFRPLCLIVLYCTLSPLSTAQDPLGGFYDLDDFGITMQAPKDHVALTCRFNEDHLVIRADIAPNWHLYSVTQPDGATIRSTFKFESPELKLQEIRPTTAPHVDSNAIGFDVDIEEHDNAVTWILTFQEKLSGDKAIKGQLNGQVCQSGEGGMCVLVKVPFEAVFDSSLDTASLLKQAESVADRFVFSETADGRRQTAADSSAVLDVQETVNVGNYWWALLFAFLGGIILNFMPCVLPVIGLKILSFFEQAGQSRSRALMLNVYYSLGLLTVFLFLACLSLGLSILFTFDLFGIIMACIVFVMALSLMDIWTLSVPGALGGKTSNTLTNQEGVLGAFFKGIITTLLAIPCGAPFLSPAVNWADVQIRSGNMPQVFLMYSVIGLGMASPYLLLGAFPEWLRFLPKPGKWMETFKKTMGFCLLLAVVWILYFVPVEKVLPTIALLFALWFVCWLFGEQQFAGRVKKRNYIISPVVLGLVVLCSYQIPGVPNSYTLESAMRVRIYGHQGEHWKPYSKAAFESARSSGKTVIVDFTADWCVNCKALEAMVLQSEAILTLLDEKQIVSLTGDCTRDGEAMELLLQLGPFQVPTLAIFDPSAPDKPTAIRGYYTQQTLTELLSGT